MTIHPNFVTILKSMELPALGSEGFRLRLVRLDFVESNMFEPNAVPN